MKKHKTRIYAFDFDGVIARYNGFKGTKHEAHLSIQRAGLYSCGRIALFCLYAFFMYNKDMQRSILILALMVAIGTVGLFGMLSFGVMNHAASHYCPISGASLEYCVSRAEMLAFVQHHISSVRSAIQMIFEQHVTALLFAMLLFAMFGLLQKRILCNNKITVVGNVYYKRNLFAPIFYAQFLLRRWMILRTKRDPSRDNIRARLPVFA